MVGFVNSSTPKSLLASAYPLLSDFQNLMQRSSGEPATLDLSESFTFAGRQDAKRKLLLLEDEPQFRELMRDFLTSQGFDVTAVQNGVEGVHEMLAKDFDVILCDMMMPTMPGDMFYRAVERMRPHLCDRFIFMSGHRGSAKVNEFVRAVNGTLLSKPFQVSDLLEMIAFVQVRMAVG